MKKHLFCLFIMVSTLGLYAADYRVHANELRATVWGWNMEAFKNSPEVPEKYKNESAVIIARHEQIEATSKNKFRMNALLFGDVNKELYYTHIDRIMVKLNDKKALAEYSELSFKEEQKTVGYLRSNKLKTVVGARILKPDGTVQEVDVDADAVTITEGKKDKEAFKKLAIKGLEVGDILDYFYAEEMELETLNAPSSLFPFFSRYPTLSYSAECVLGNQLTVEYRSLNGAPEFQQSTNEDNNVVLKISAKDLTVVDNLKLVRWKSIIRDLPLVRLVMLNNSSKLIYKPASARKKGVYKNVDPSNILKDKRCELATTENQMFWMKDIYKKVNSAIQNYKQKMPGATNEDMALYIYDALRFYWPSNYYDYSYDKFHLALEKLLKENSIECKMCLTTSSYGARSNEIVNAEDLYTFVSANDNKQLFFMPNGYKYAGEIPFMHQGEMASAASVIKYKSNSPDGLEGLVTEFQVPIASSSQNSIAVKSVISFSDDNPQELILDRHVSAIGGSKDDMQNTLLLFEDWDKLMRKRLLLDMDIWQELAADKDRRKFIDRYKTSFEEKRKAQEELIRSEIKEYHGTNSGDMLSYSIGSLGSTPDAPAFKYEVKYKMDGMVKRAGNDLILDAGKLIAQPWTPSEKERKRVLDVYLETPVVLEWETAVVIPNQYTVEGIDKLNKSIENNFGKFISVASLEGDTLKIKAVKAYNTSFIDKKDWPRILEIVDKNNEFTAQSVMLKRKD